MWQVRHWLSLPERGEAKAVDYLMIDDISEPCLVMNLCKKLFSTSREHKFCCGRQGIASWNIVVENPVVSNCSH